MRDVICVPKDYNEWICLKRMAKHKGHNVYYDGYYRGDTKESYERYPYLIAQRIDRGWYVQGSSTEKPKVSVRKFKELLGLVEIRPMTYCQSHKFSLI